MNDMIKQTTLFALPLFAVGLLNLVGCSTPSASSVAPPPSMPAMQVVDVTGTHMTLDGTPWLSRGVVLQGFVQPLAALQAGSNAAKLNARENYGETELTALQDYHADTIRFQIGQPSLDPHSPLYDANYLNDIVAAIKLARQNGFVVMIMMQDEAISGETSPHPLPTAETQSDWDLFTEQFGSDRGVVFELYNEPNLPNTAANWQFWLNGGLVPGQTIPSIGMQQLIMHIRAQGSQNVFVLDGLALAKTLSGQPVVSDPLSRLVYAVHPYQGGSADESEWDTNFGIPSQTEPVWADEWSAPAGLPIGLGNLPSYQVAVDLVNYLQAHSIPLCTGAWDVPRFVVQAVPGWKPNNYDNYTADSTTDGSGTLVFNAFLAKYSRVLTPADGL